MEYDLTFALPKGRLLPSVVQLLQTAGLLHSGLEENGRRLMHTDQQAGIRYLICRAADVPTYVEYGAADLGVSGKDVLFEQGKEICELLDLGFGSCKFAVAVPSARLDDFRQGLEGYLARYGQLRVATKFPRVASAYLQRRGLPGEIIKLSGNIELAPLVGLAEVIIDIVSTGRTLEENNLVKLEEISEATARLVANRVAYRLKYRRLNEILEALRGIVGRGEAVC
jgi:ATP phosphoribosyltransferase